MTVHLTSEQLNELLIESGTEPVIEPRFTAHLATCEQCSSRVELFRRATRDFEDISAARARKESLEVAFKSVRSPETSWIDRQRRFSVASAALACAVLIGIATSTIKSRNRHTDIANLPASHAAELLRDNEWMSHMNQDLRSDDRMVAAFAIADLSRGRPNRADHQGATRR